MNSSARVKVYGVNISKLYKLLKQNNIEMKNIDRVDYKNIYFSVQTKSLKKLFALTKNSCYNVEVVEYYGLKKITNFLKNRLGYLIGAGIFLLIVIISNFFVSDIKIYGTNKLEIKEISNVLSQNNIRVGGLLSHYDCDEISSLLSNNFDEISLISVIKKGTTIIINIKEKQSLDMEKIINQDD